MSVRRSEVCNAGAVSPGVPHNDLVEIVPRDAVLGLPGLRDDHGSARPAGGRVDAVDLLGDAEGGIRGGVCGDGLGEFIDIRRGFETRDRNL